MMREHRLRTARTARVQSLGDVDGAPDVWIVIHGYGQLASDFITPFAAIAGPERAVVAPEALNRFYREREGASGGHSGRPVGATWMTREDRDADIADYVEYLDAVAARMSHGRPLTVLGFSQGVSTLLRWVATGATTVQRVIAWAGELPADIDLVEYRDRFPARGVDVVVGSVDEYAKWINLDGMRRRLAEAAMPHRVHLFDGGHRLDRATLLSLAHDR
ncbi:MAG: esterase [Gemmatimonadaceae bacterium]|nr:esterase [Gemmatimonadaceae bacterium]